MIREAREIKEGEPLAKLEVTTAQRIYKELRDEACDYVMSGLSLKQFFNKHKTN